MPTKILERMFRLNVLETQVTRHEFGLIYIHIVIMPEMMMNGGTKAVSNVDKLLS